MASIDIEVANRRYNVACREGEEEHFRLVAALVDKRAKDAAAALGGLTETRQLLFASLLLADDIKELRAGNPIPDPEPAKPDPALAEALEALAARMENLAESLERGAPSA